ncbi:MAG: succinate dehydrogenase assembly factor 2 [Litoreibacter sp.]
MVETRETRIKRMRMRSWRRGIKEMDLILGGFSDNGLSRLSDAELAIYDIILEENDHDLYFWCSGQGEAPAEFSDLLQKIMRECGAV